MKVEVLRSEGSSEGNYLVERIDGSGLPFEVKAQELATFGSHDPESEHEIRKRKELETLKVLLKERDYTIESVGEDGNCLYRAVARQIYGDQEEYRKVRKWTVKWITANKSYFSNFETDIDERLSEQRKNHSWGGNLEIQAISEFYNVGIILW